MLLAILIWLFTIITTIAFASRHWWFPESVSAHGEFLDGQFVVTLVVTGIVFILAQVALGRNRTDALDKLISGTVWLDNLAIETP